MTKITLTTDQVVAIQHATDMIKLHDERGKLIAHAALAAKRLHSEGSWYTTVEVQDHLMGLARE